MEIEFPSGFCYLILYFFKCQNVIKHITSIYLMNLDIFLEWNRVKTKSNILPIVFFELTNLSAICRFCYREKKKHAIKSLKWIIQITIQDTVGLKRIEVVNLTIKQVFGYNWFHFPFSFTWLPKLRCAIGEAKDQRGQVWDL